MNRIQTAAAAGALCCPCAFADPVFFDDFDGDDLKPWWSKSSECGDWEYNVSDSMLHVTKIKKIKNCGNYLVKLGASLDYLADFDATALVGWDEGEYQNPGFSFIGTSLLAIGGFGYHKYPGKSPYFSVQLSDGISSQKVEFPAPPTGMHEWRLTRQGDLLSAFVDGQLVLQVIQDIRFEAVSARFGFLGAPDSPLFAPLHVDRVMVAPAPGALFGVPLGLLVAWRRRRPAI